MKVLKIIQDSDSENPLEFEDGHYPCITEGKDFSNGAIDRYLKNYLTYNQVVRHQKTLCKMMGIDHSYIVMQYPESEHRMTSIIDDLSNFISYSPDNKAKFCQLFKIKHFYKTTRGYSQGDAIDVFICWTPEFEKLTGVSYKMADVSSMEYTFKQYGHWIWGDVYGFKVIKKKVCGYCGETHKKELDSCWGFYGRDHFESGLADAVRHHFEELSDKDFKKMIENVKIKY
jgi:hypothetical protein